MWRWSKKSVSNNPKTSSVKDQLGGPEFIIEDRRGDKPNTSNIDNNPRFAQGL